MAPCPPPNPLAPGLQHRLACHSKIFCTFTFLPPHPKFAPMLLTLKPPLQNGLPGPYAYSSPPPPPPLRSFSPSGSKGSALPPLPDTQPRRMSTPHRGLPPPLAMTLPNPDRGPPPPPPLAHPQHMGQLPAPPNQYQDRDDSMRNWLAAKTEEDKRKQEEEKTRQETLRLERRKIEQAMLRESLQGGIPPHMVPMVFAGMGGANLTNASLEWAQHYMDQMSLQQHQQHQVQVQQQSQAALPPPGSPDLRRDRSVAGPQPNPYAQHQPIQGTSTHSSAASGYGYDRLRSNQQSIQAAPPTSAPRPSQAGLSRLNTGEMQIQPPPQPGAQLPSQPSIQQSHSSQHSEAQSTPTSIYFHHWVPPNSNKEPPTPSGKSQQSSPHSQNAGSHLRSEQGHSPKRRKTATSHIGLSSKTPDTSPALSQFSSAGRRRAQSIQRGETSFKGTHEAYSASGSRPASRHRQQSTSEAESGSQRHGSSQPETTQSRHESAGPERKRTGSGTPKHETELPS